MMGLFDKLKKNPAAPEPASVEWPVVISACAKGSVLKMADVPDPVFSEGVLGFCCGIEPAEGKVYAPVDGKVTQVAGSRHALGFAGPGGVEILIHVGVDTVEMNGDGFAPLVKAGDAVKKGQMVLTMDLDKIRAAGHPTAVITVAANSGDFSGVDLTEAGEVEVGAELLTVRK